MKISFVPVGAGYDVFDGEDFIGMVYKTLMPYSYRRTEVWKAKPHQAPADSDATYHDTRKGAVAALQLFAQNRKARVNA